jgi:hypothetical protein
MKTTINGTDAILLQSANARVTEAVAALLSYDQEGERNPIVHIVSTDPERHKILESYYPISIHFDESSLSLIHI